MTKPLDEDGVRRAMAAIVGTWVAPELRCRIENGTLPDDFKLAAYQVITDATGVPTEVRLNDEVRGVVRVRTTREQAMDDVVLGAPTVGGPFEILLTDADPNAGHVTAIQTGDGGWFTSIDLRLNAAQAAKHAAAAREYLNSAAAALQRGDMLPFVQNLLDATELMAKTYLLTMPSGFKPGKTHDSVQRPFNLEGKDGKVNDRYTSLLNRLRGLRGSARYLTSDLELDAAEALEMLATGEEMYRVLGEIVPKRAAATTS